MCIRDRGYTSWEYLNKLCFEGLERLYDPVTPELRERLEYELNTIKNMGYVDYFLIVWDFIHYARSNGIEVGPGPVSYTHLFNYDPNYPGCGAAGGLGFAFRTFLHGKLEPGISIVLEEIGIENQIKNADIVITGEGRLDGQTVMGKAPIGIARLAKRCV